jgi:hypothetical protein
MFYLLKHLLLLILVIFKLTCNNLIFNEIIILNASYVCLLHSRFIKNQLIWILEDGPLISEVVLSHLIRKVAYYIGFILTQVHFLDISSRVTRFSHH